MIKTGFHIGKRDWWVMCYMGIEPFNLPEIQELLLASGCDERRADKACRELRRKNTGYTFTDFDSHATVMLVSRTTSAEQMFDSLVHELKHLTEHVSEFFGLDPQEELSAYLQGEVGRLLWPAAALALCPRCSPEWGRE